MRFSPKEKIEGLRVVCITFNDVYLVDELYESELKKGSIPVSPYTCIGFLINETKDSIMICQSILHKIDDFKHDETRYRNVLNIPKALIISMEEYEILREPRKEQPRKEQSHPNTLIIHKELKG